MIHFDSKVSYNYEKKGLEVINNKRNDADKVFTEGLNRKNSEFDKIKKILIEIKEENNEYEKNLAEIREKIRRTRSIMDIASHRFNNTLTEYKQILRDFLEDKIQITRLLMNGNIPKSERDIEHIIVMYNDRRIEYEGALSIVIDTLIKDYLVESGNPEQITGAFFLSKRTRVI